MEGDDRALTGNARDSSQGLGTAPRFWTWERDMSKGWACRIRVGRVQFGGTIIRHRYPRATSPDRWVFRPEVIYDRAR